MINGLIDMCLFKSYQKACSYPHGMLLYVQRVPSFTDLVDNTKTIKAISDPLCLCLLDACLHHSVLAGSETGAGHVAFKYQRRFDFVEFLQ